MSSAREVRLYALADGEPRLVAGELDVQEATRLLAVLPPGVYEGLRTYHGTRFLGLAEHLDRCERSGRALGFELEPDRAALVRALDAVARATAPGDSRLRFDVLHEPAELLGVSARIWILAQPLEPVPRRFLAEGVGVALATELRRARPLIKTTEFVERRQPLPLGSQEAYEHLMLDAEGGVLEGTSSNFFAVRDGRLVTAGERVLEGVTRGIVLRLATELELEVELASPPAREAAGWDEAFLTSSSRSLVPVVVVGGVRVGGGRPGPLTRRLMAAYEDLVEREARPAV